MSAPDSRAEVFARIREALRVEAPHRHAPHSHDADTKAPPTLASKATEEKTIRAWLPKVGDSFDQQVALFAQNSTQLQTSFQVVKDLSEATEKLKALATQNGWKRVATHMHPLAEKAALALDLPVTKTNAGYAPLDLEACDVAITGCDTLIAQTGSVFVTTESAGGRALSVLPPHHVVIAERSQMVPDLVAALALARDRYARKWPSFLSFITGPSRTGDIERILVLGAHGPKQLTIFLIA